MYNDSQLKELETAAKLGAMTSEEQARLVKEYRALRGARMGLVALLADVRLHLEEELAMINEEIGKGKP